METYAFWRPPVRTLTFEDFTTMQKQQGKAVGQSLCQVIELGRSGSGPEYGTSGPKPSQAKPPSDENVVVP